MAVAETSALWFGGDHQEDAADEQVAVGPAWLGLDQFDGIGEIGGPQHEVSCGPFEIAEAEEFAVANGIDRLLSREIFK